MPLIVTVNTIAEYLRTDCNILGDKIKKYILILRGSCEVDSHLTRMSCAAALIAEA